MLICSGKKKPQTWERMYVNVLPYSENKEVSLSNVYPAESCSYKNVNCWLLINVYETSFKIYTYVYIDDNLIF